MPELPEVETCRRIVERRLSGRRVEAVLVRLPKMLRFSPISTLEPLVGESISGARRRAKILIIDFTNDLSLLIHFKLAGQLAVHLPSGERDIAGHPVPDPLGPYPHKTSHVEFLFDGGITMYLSDVRQFGWLRLMPTVDVASAIDAFKLGAEANGADGISVDALRAKLDRRSISIKQALLDQSVVAGIGNIYVDEALHRAKVHPATPSLVVARGDISGLLDAIRWALDEGTRQGGARIVHGKAYPVDGFPEVHAREALPCPVCETAIIKTRVGGRGTYLCPTCQPEP